jgi:cell division protein FtsN
MYEKLSETEIQSKIKMCEDWIAHLNKNKEAIKPYQDELDELMLLAGKKQNDTKDKSDSKGNTKKDTVAKDESQTKVEPKEDENKAKKANKPNSKANNKAKKGGVK